MIEPGQHPTKKPTLSSLHICGDQKSIKYLYDLVMQINKGVYSYEEEEDELVVAYLSNNEAKDAFNKLHDKLYNLHPELIGHPDGVTIEDGVLYFKGCKV